MTNDPNEIDAAELDRHRPAAGQRLLGAPTTRAFQLAEVRALAPEGRWADFPRVLAFRPAAGCSAFAGGGGDEFGDFFALLLVEDAARHPARSGGAVDAVFDGVEDAAFGRFDRVAALGPAGGP